MELQDYIRIIRKRWRVIVAATIVALVAAGVLTWLTPRQYQSTAQLFVSTGSGQDTSELAAGSTFTQKQVKTYADLVSTPRVLEPVIRKQALGTTPVALAKSVNATVPVDTVLINVAVTDLDPARSAQIAGAIASELTRLVPDLETVGSTQSPVKLSVVAPPQEGVQVRPQPVRNVGLGLVLGLLLGLGLALLRDRLDTTVKRERDVQEITDATVIGGIHYDKDAPAHPLIIQSDPHSPRSEAFRSVRTNLQFIDVSNPPRAFALTSSLPGEGKTTTATNLALTMAAGGSTVCVVEGDLRRARLLEYMGLESGVGLTNVLIGEVELDDVLQPFADTSVTVLGAGPVPPNPSELLGSQKMREVLDTLREKFDYVIIDTPPLLPVTDAAVVSTLVDGAVVVVGAGLIRKESVARALDILDTVGARNLGLLLNRLPAKDHGRYAYYGYYSDEHAPTSNAKAGLPWRKEAKRPRRRKRDRASTSAGSAVAAQDVQARHSVRVVNDRGTRKPEEPDLDRSKLDRPTLDQPSGDHSRV